MVLAAGEGRRLRPLTEKTPKALVPVGGKPVLERVLGLLRDAGATAAVVNTFHLAEPVEEFLGSKDFGLEVEISREKVLLDTGGGLKNAARFFAGEREPFFLYNADVVSDVDLKALYAAHRGLATLAVADRPTKRRLLFDGGRLVGRETADGDELAAIAKAPVERLAFNGIHVISPELLGKITETGIFPILRPYLRLAAAGERIHSFRMDKWFWTDIGDFERLDKARRWAGS